MTTGNTPLLPRLSPIAIKERVSFAYVEKGNLDVQDGAFVVVDITGVRTHIPVGGVTCLMLEPGTRITHAAVALAARVGCLIIWVGEAGVRLYSAGQPGGARADRLLFQARLALDEDMRLKVVRQMYKVRFGEEPPAKRSVQQLQGIEGARVRKIYELFARQFGVQWKGRNYDVEDWKKGDVANQCLSAATSCLYGITEAAILAAGYAPAIGFIHTGKPLSFVYDIADLFKFETVVPIAFKIAARKVGNPDQVVRLECRDVFRSTNLLERIIPIIEDVLSAGGLSMPEEPDYAVNSAIPEHKELADDGHRA
ncbi:MAG: type I-E CRISPR-associated endonuclease Cas1e [Candidatus Omnitrophota bacterium]